MAVLTRLRCHFKSATAFLMVQNYIKNLKCQFFEISIPWAFKLRQRIQSNPPHTNPSTEKELLKESL